MDDELLSGDQLQDLTQKLAAARGELEQQAHWLKPSTQLVALDQQSVGRVSRIDALARQAMDSARSAQGNERLRAVMIAQARLQSGDYGHCAHCDAPIGYARLAAKPETPLCVACQQRAETAAKG